jgi:hypothetical protein
LELPANKERIAHAGMTAGNAANVFFIVQNPSRVVWQARELSQ